MQNLWIFSQKISFLAENSFSDDQIYDCCHKNIDLVSTSRTSGTAQALLFTFEIVLIRFVSIIINILFAALFQLPLLPLERWELDHQPDGSVPTSGAAGAIVLIKFVSILIC